ncbi:MAG: hypothetical protein ACXVH3_12420 [Solirubrobacteraceae bacterium]
MALARVCSEWGLAPACKGSLEGMSPQAKTCSVACRQHRARRLRKQNVDAGALEATRSVRELVRAGGKDAIQEVLKTELAPVVREAIDEDVLQAISKMVGLTTKAVEVLARDLDGEDAVLAQRAAALVVKYTVGHPALVKPVDETPPQLEVHFNLPRPEAGAPRYDEEGEVLAETKVCDSCGTEKPMAEFVAGSDRCAPCFEEARRKVLERFT